MESTVYLFVKRTVIHACLVIVLSLVLIGYSAAGNRWIHVEGGNWIPTPEEFSLIKQHMKAYVSNQAQAKGRQLREWASYTFQYQGQIEKGKEFIFINAFCIKTSGRPLNKLMLFVADGGPCFFNVRYDPETGQFFNLLINGEG